MKHALAVLASLTLAAPALAAVVSPPMPAAPTTTASSQAPVNAAKPDESSHDLTRLETEVAALAQSYLAKKGAVGFSIAIARGERVLLARGYGLAEAEFEAKADADTMFRIGSVTKQFTAALVMRYVEQGKIGLDDDLSKYVPTFPLQGKHVTIRQLLNHTSGIPSYTDVGEAWEKVWTLELSHEELLALVADKPFDFEPGSKWNYNNTGYYLLGMVLEKVGGKPYATLVSNEIAKPLGLSRTRRDSNVDLIKNRAQGYTLQGGITGPRLVNDQPYGTNQPGAAGMLLSTARDLVTWQIALTSGRVVSKDSFAQMTTPTKLADGTDTGYGFGLMVDEYEGHRRISHGGGIFGFNSMLAWFPDDDLHVAVISNSEPIRSGAIADDLVWIALGTPRPAVQDVTIPAETLQRLSGTFAVPQVGFDLVVSNADGKLYAQGQAPGQSRFRLQWQGGDEFRADFDRDVRIVFSSDGGTLRLYQGGGVFQGTRKP